MPFHATQSQGVAICQYWPCLMYSYLQRVLYADKLRDRYSCRRKFFVAPKIQKKNLSIFSNIAIAVSNLYGYCSSNFALSIVFALNLFSIFFTLVLYILVYVIISVSILSRSKGRWWKVKNYNSWKCDNFRAIEKII